MRSLTRIASAMLVVASTLALFPAVSRAADDEADRPPNFVIVFADDLGYGDLSAYGHPTIRTPHLDRMAREGMRLTQFYSAAPVCTPSRAALLTGRLPVRNGMCSDRRRVLFPDSKGGLPAEERTIAEALRERGYATACVGKWHLGHRPEFLPTRQGFDRYFGIPYSNDMDRDPSKAPQGRAAFRDPKPEYWNVPLLSGEKEIERPADQRTITSRYTEEAVRFIRESRDRPFFLYLAHNLPHVPLFAGEEFRGRSARGLYGDVIEEIDHGVGKILDTLREEGLAERTFVIFTSDNGPWLTFADHGGSAGLLRAGKGTTWEGGVRVPCIVWRPGTVPAGVIHHGLASTLDLFPTLVRLAGASLPSGVELDGVDQSRMLLTAAESAREVVWYYRGTQLYAVRKGPFKAHFITEGSYGGPARKEHDPPLLYHLEHDPSEAYDVAASHPDVVAELKGLFDRQREAVKPAASQLEL